MKKHIIALIAASVVTLSVFLVASFAHANPSFFLSPTSSATATTTVMQISANPAVSQTLVFDSNITGRPYAADTATLLVQATASSSSSIVNITYQYSYNGIDYFGDNLQLGSATTTQPVNVVNSSVWTPGTTATTSRAFTMPVPTRFVKAIFSATTATSSLYVSIVPKQEAI